MIEPAAVAQPNPAPGAQLAPAGEGGGGPLEVPAQPRQAPPGNEEAIKAAYDAGYRAGRVGAPATGEANVGRSDVPPSAKGATIAVSDEDPEPGSAASRRRRRVDDVIGDRFDVAMDTLTAATAATTAALRHAQPQDVTVALSRTEAACALSLLAPTTAMRRAMLTRDGYGVREVKAFDEIANALSAAGETAPAGGSGDSVSRVVTPIIVGRLEELGAAELGRLARECDKHSRGAVVTTEDGKSGPPATAFVDAIQDAHQRFQAWPRATQSLVTLLTTTVTLNVDPSALGGLQTQPLKPLYVQAGILTLLRMSGEEDAYHLAEVLGERLRGFILSGVDSWLTRKTRPPKVARYAGATAVPTDGTRTRAAASNAAGGPRAKAMDDSFPCGNKGCASRAQRQGWKCATCHAKSRSM